jgi:hypothetical protein
VIYSRAISDALKSREIARRTAPDETSGIAPPTIDPENYLDRKARETERPSQAVRVDSRARELDVSLYLTSSFQPVGDFPTS